MSDRRQFLLCLGALAATPLVCGAQSGVRAYRVGMLLMTSRAHPGANQLLQAFFLELRELGYVEGRNLHFEWREAEGKIERLPALAAELATERLDLIVAGGHEAAVAARRATHEMPVVFVAARDPLGAGLVGSLARPGANVTGFTVEVLAAKRLELLQEIAPRIRKVAVIAGPDDPPHIADMQASSLARELQLLVYELRIAQELDGVLRSIERDGAQGLLVITSMAAYLQRHRILAHAASRRLPAVYPLNRWAQDGGLVSYAMDYADNWRRSGAYVHRILQGERAGSLPVQRPTKFDLVVNLRAARAMGITVPRSVLLRANRVIE